VGCDHYHVKPSVKALVIACVLGLGPAAASTGCASPGPIDRAQQLVRMHREGEAIGTLRAQLAKHPDDVGARRLLVRVLAFTGDLEAAKVEVAELERRLPNDPVPWIELGHAFELTHRYDEALAAYDTAASVAPTSPAGPREGGMRAARWGEPEEALPRLEEAVKRGAADAELFHALGLVRLHMKDLDGAVAAYERGFAVDPKSTENLLGLATVAVVRGDAKGALAAYDRILERKPAYSGAEMGRAWALAKLGRSDEARRALDHAAELGASRENVARQRADLK
jgi:Flp pilus assembly protein TadD